MSKIIIDTDMAFGSPKADIDDALALLMAFSLDLNIEAVTAVGGNVSADKASRNIDTLLNRIGKESVHHSYSAANPIDPFNWVFSRWNSSDEGFVHRSNFPALASSVDVIKQTIESSDEPVVIVTLGPMTNVATFLKLYPYLSSKIETIYSMGGSIHTEGVAKSFVEFNIKSDPEAAFVVFSSSIPVHLFPLDVTKKKKIYPETIERWSVYDGLIRDLYKASVSFMGYRAKRDGYEPTYAFYHDVLPVVALVHPEFFVLEKCSISVELNSGINRGLTLIDTTKDGCYVATDVDCDSLFSFIEGQILSHFGGYR